MGLLSRIFSSKQQATLLEYDSKATNYKMDSLEQIESIPVPTKKFEYNCDFTQSIEYVLQRKATQFKKEGKIDLAIACLKKSNEIMPFCNMNYSKKDYLRYPEFLKQNGKFEEAKNEEIAINKLFEKHNSTKDILNRTKEISSNDTLDDKKLVVIPREGIICENCAKYHDRIYSVNGKDSRFPNLELFENYIANKKCNCSLLTFPFIEGISIFRGVGANNPISHSNRPFVDDKTEEEKRIYNAREDAILEEKKDRADYDWIRENLPDIAPKSFGGYRNMKNKNSTNYQKIVSVAKDKGYTI